MRRALCPTGLILLLAAACTAPRDATREQHPECRFTCRVTVDREVALGDAQAGVVSWNQIVAELGAEFFVSHASSESEIQVFGREGHHVRNFGRAGAGPGEFRGITNVEVGPAGNLWVFDGGNRSLKVVTPAGEFVSAHPARFAVSRGGVVVLPDSSVIVNALASTPDRTGLWTHRWHPTRGFLWSVDPGDATATGRVQQRTYAVGGGFLWTARRWGDYRIEKRSLETGELVAAYDLARPWFDDFQEEVGAGRGSDETGLVRPRATISDLAFADGRLWVLGYTPDRRWARAEEDGYRNLGTLLDNVVDVISADGKLLVTTRLDLENGVGASFLGGLRVVAHETGDLLDRATVYRLGLRGPVPR